MISFLYDWKSEKKIFSLKMQEVIEMINILMNGCNGKMGQMITGLVKEDDQVTIAAGVDTYQGVQNTYPVFDTIGKCDVDVDVVIDFSNAAALERVLTYCIEKQVPVILCSTGYSEEQLWKISEGL